MYEKLNHEIAELTDSKRIMQLALMESLPVDSRVVALKNPNFTDIDILMQIAKNDSNHRLRLAAASNPNLITHQDFLVDIAKNDSYFYVRYEVCNFIQDDDVLADIIKNEADHRVCYSAYKNISDEDILVDIAYATSNDDIQENAVPRINDPQCLLYLVRQGANFLVRRSAFSRLLEDFPDLILMPSQVKDVTDEDRLLDIVKNEWYYESKLQACSMIKNEKVLLDIILDFSNREGDVGYYGDKSRFHDDMVRTAFENIEGEEALSDVVRMGIYEINSEAADKLKAINPKLDISEYDDIAEQDEETLKYIAKNSINHRNRFSAVTYIDDEDFLCDIVRTDLCIDVRKGCLKKISNQKTLGYVAKNDLNQSIRKKAVKKIANPEILMDIVHDCPDDYINGDIITIAIEGINDDKFLYDFAMNNKNSYFNCTLAIKSISNQECLRNIVRNSKEPDIIQYALNNINDISFKYEIAKGNPSFYVKILNYDEIDDERDIERVIWDYPDWNLIEGALEYIKDKSILENLAQNAPSAEVRRYAVRYLKYGPDYVPVLKADDEGYGENNHLFLKIAMGDSSYYVRREAVLAIEDESIRIDLALNHPSSGVRKTAVSCISDFSCLFEVYENDSNDDVRYNAVNNGFFKNQDLLIDIAKNDSYFPIVLVSLKKIKDLAVVKEICRNSGDKLLCAFYRDVEYERYPRLGGILF